VSASKIEEIEILWLTAGLGCDGDTIAMTGATQPSIEDIGTGALPWIPKVNFTILFWRSPRYSFRIWKRRTGRGAICWWCTIAIRSMRRPRTLWNFLPLVSNRFSIIGRTSLQCSLKSANGRSVSWVRALTGLAMEMTAVSGVERYLLEYRGRFRPRGSLAPGGPSGRRYCGAEFGAGCCGIPCIDRRSA
jgi:hypothetical protein